MTPRAQKAAQAKQPDSSVRRAVAQAVRPDQPAPIESPVPAEQPVQFARQGACDFLRQKYQMEMTPIALAMHDARGTGPKRRVILNRTYYLRTALDQWVEEMGERGAR